MANNDFDEHTFSNTIWRVKKRYTNLIESQNFAFVSVWYEFHSLFF